MKNPDNFDAIGIIINLSTYFRTIHSPYWAILELFHKRFRESSILEKGIKLLKSIEYICSTVLKL